MEMRKQRTTYSPKPSQSKTKGNAEKKQNRLILKHTGYLFQLPYYLHITVFCNVQPYKNVIPKNQLIQDFLYNG